MLKDPFLDEPYTPKISAFLGGIEIYDKEEALGEELWRYNPNDAQDRDRIIREHIISSLRYLSYRHRFVLLEALRESLLDVDLDFSILFGSNYDEHTVIAWEADEIDSPRKFFEDVYRIASEVWENDLIKASAEDKLAW